MLVERIDLNTADALNDITDAKKELTEVYENVSSNRKLMMKVFFILLVFATFYILFVL
jgi:syntaxin 5